MEIVLLLLRVLVSPLLLAWLVLWAIVASIVFFGGLVLGLVVTTLEFIIEGF